MRTFLITIATLFAVVILAFTLTQNAEASTPTFSSCSVVRVEGALDAFREYTLSSVILNDPPGNCASDTDFNDLEVAAGGSFTLHCQTRVNGVTPPGVANTITTRIYADGVGFPDGTGQIRSQSLTSCPLMSGASSSETVTYHCTSDGTSTGSPRFGPLRLYIRMFRSDIGTYDENSEDDDTGKYGIVLCTGSANAFTDGLGAGGSPSVYQGGDTLRQTLTLDEVAYNANKITLRLTCGTSQTGTVTGTSLVNTRDITIDTETAGCDLTQRAEIGLMSLTGYTAVRYSEWDAIPSGASSISNVIFQKDISPTISYTGSIDSIPVSLEPGGVDNEIFIIGNDQEYIRIEGYRDPRGTLRSGVAISCFRTRPDMTTEGSVAMGSTDASGNVPSTEFGVVAPAGNWKATCSGSFSGNTASILATFTHGSALTSDTNILITLNATKLSNGTYSINVTAIGRMYDEACDCVVKAFADGDVRLTVQKYQTIPPSFENSETVRIIMPQIHVSSAAWNETVFIDPDEYAFPVLFYVTTQMAGRDFIASNSFIPSATSASNEGDFRGNFRGNFTTHRGDLLLMPPDALTIPSLILAISMTGIFLGFLIQSKNPWVSLYGAIFQLVAIILALQFKTDLEEGPIDLFPILMLLSIGSMMVLLWRVAFRRLEEKAEIEAAEA